MKPLNKKQKKAIQLIKQGFTLQEVVHQLNISRTTLWRWNNKIFKNTVYEFSNTELAKQKLNKLLLEDAKTTDIKNMVFVYKELKKLE